MCFFTHEFAGGGSQVVTLLQNGQQVKSSWITVI